jgi:hypothetical protein
MKDGRYIFFSGRNILILCVVLFILAGCSRGYMNQEHPLTFTQNRLTLSPGEDGRMKNLLALLLAFDDHRWTVTEINCEEMTVVARSQKGQTEGEAGIPVHAGITGEGTIKLYHLYGQDLSSGWADYLQRWMNNLERSYNKYDNRDLAWLKKELLSRGITIPCN